MMKPTIHSNGTSAKQLFEQYAEAAGALRKAMVKLQDAAPHGRDYYPQGRDALRQAEVDFLGLHTHLEVVLKEIEDLAEYVGEHM